MSRRAKNDENRRRLLELWSPPASAGDPIAAMATSYTFHADFFEKECLPRFLRLETDPDEDGAAHLVEREERLRDCWVGVLLDVSSMDEARGLSWDLLSSGVPGGIMHAKVSLLAWSRLVRIVVSSANLTEPGYRRNLEVAGVLDLHPDRPSPVASGLEVITFLRALVDAAPEKSAAQRATTALGRIEAHIRGFEGTVPSDNSHEVRPVLVGPGRPPLLEQVAVSWNGAWGVWRDATVTSPFFDEAATGAVRALEAAMAQRGERSVTFVLEGARAADQMWELRAPTSLLEARPDAVLCPVDAKADGDQRPLHAKAIRLRGNSGCAYYVGSSNFTRAGLGLGPKNVEAGLVYMVGDGDKTAKAFDSAFVPALDPVPHDSLRLIRPDPAMADAAPDHVVTIPAGFLEAVFEAGPPAEVVVRVAPEKLPSTWHVEAGRSRVFDSATLDGSVAELCSTWTGVAPSTLEVVWMDGQGTTHRKPWWVNVSDRAKLPEPDALRHLSLSALLDVLTMSRPLYEALRLLRDETERVAPNSAELDPHARVDTRAFILQRARRFARALRGLEQRLAQPCYTEAGLEFRIRGPVGPLRLADAIERESTSADETAFMLAEIALSCGRVKPPAVPGALPAEAIRQGLRAAVSAIEEKLRRRSESLEPTMRDYVTEATREARR